jgi:hypothetical protein
MRYLVFATLLATLSLSATSKGFADSENSWESSENIGNGWRQSSWFGLYYETLTSWIYHQDHGWLYRHSENTTSIWLYDPMLGWLWTTNSIYPFLSQHSEQKWLYYIIGSSDPRTFYDYDQSKIRNEDALKVSSASTTSYEWDSGIHFHPGTDWNVTDQALTFRWKRTLKQNEQGQYVAAQKFRLQVDDDSAFGSPVIDDYQNSPVPSYPDDAEAFSRWTYLSYMPKNLLPSGTYYWRVRAEDGNGSAWSTSTRFVVNDDHEASSLVYALGSDSPLFTFDMFFGSGTEPLLGKIPAIRSSFPESIRSHIAYAIHCEAIGQDPTHDDGFDGNLLDLIKPIADSGVQIMIKSGGPDKDFQQFADLTEVEEIYKQYPNVIGLVLGETFWDFIDSEDNATIRDLHLQWYKRSFQLSAKYGRLVIWGNGNDEHFVWDKFLGEENSTNPWMTPAEFESVAKNLVIAPKNNIPFGHFHAESAVMGAWLAGRTQQWGVWSEGWAWGSIGYDKLFGDQLKGDANDPDFSTMPYNIWLQMKLAGLSQGATVFHFGGESSVVEWGEYDAVNDRFNLGDHEYLNQSTAFWDMSGNEHPSLQRYVVPFMKAVVEHGLIPSKSEVLDKLQLAVTAPAPEISKGSALDYGSYAPLFIATNELPGYISIAEAMTDDPEVEYYELIPNANRRELLRDNGRHYATPILPYPANSLSDNTTIISLSDANTTEAFQALIDPLYPETQHNTAWVVQLKGRLYVSNGLENTNENRSFSVSVENFGNLSGTIQPHTYLLGKSTEENLWLMSNACGKGAYTDDRSTHLELSLTNEPSWEVIGSASANWSDGVLSIILNNQESASEIIITP